MNKATFDPANPLVLYFRIARNGTLDFVFLDANGNPYSLIYDDVELHVYQNEGDKKPVFSLVMGSGMSVVSTGRIRATVTAAITNINEGQYYYELYRPDLGKTWLADYAIFHNGRFDGLQQSSVDVIVNDGTQEVTITVSDSNFSLIQTNRQTSNYTLVLTDVDKLIELNSASAISLTVPPNSSVAFPNGTVVLVSQYGAGTASVVAGSGVTIRSAAGALSLSAQYSGASLVKIATDEWYLFGDLV
jgi:hypothetical protein